MGFIKELWADAVSNNLFEDPDLNTLFDRSYESLMRAGGNKLSLPTIASGVTLTRSDNKSVGAGLPLTPQDVSKSSIEINVYEYATEPIVIRNVDIVQGDQSLFQKNVDEIKQIIKEFVLTTVFTEIINSVAAANKKAFTGGGGASFTALNFAGMEVLLDNNKVSENDRFAALSSTDRLALMSDSSLVNYLAFQMKNLEKGQIPELYGFGVKKSALIPLTTAAGAIDVNPALNVKRNVLGWRKQHVPLVIQTEIEIIGSEDARYLGGVYSFVTRFGTKLQKDVAAVQYTQQ